MLKPRLTALVAIVLAAAVTRLVPHPWNLTSVAAVARGETLRTLQVNALFHRVSEPKDEWGSNFIVAAGSAGLAPGATTAVLTLKSPLGYKGTDPRETLLHNSQFVDATVDLFAKYGSVQWTRVGQFPITRRLIQ